MRYWIIPFVTFVLAVISIVTIRSVAPELANKQLLFFLFGFSLFFVVSRLPMDFLSRLSYPGYIFLTTLLLILLVSGSVTRGITGWFDLPFGIKFQPSQYAIPIVGLALVRWVETISVFDFKRVVQLVALISIPGFLIAVEPDFGTAFIYMASMASLFLFLQIPKRYLLVLFITGIFVAFIGWTFVLESFQKERITGFMSGGAAINQASSYNARQSVIAVGSGGVLGRGVGFGIQSHLKFLPERQTDFIFASFAEEWGLFGSAIVVGLYLTLILSILFFASEFTKSRDTLFASIVATMLIVQAGINIGMNIGIMPITGITLPLISYGGSSLTAIFITLGMVQNMVFSNKKKHILRFS